MSRRSSNSLDPTVQRELEGLDAVLAGRPVEGDLAELEDLVHAVRVERPQASEAFRGELDARVAAGFARTGAGRLSDAPGRRSKALAGRAGRRLMPALAGAASVLAAIVVAASLVGDDRPQVAGDGSLPDRPAETARPAAPMSRPGSEADDRAGSSILPPEGGDLPGRRDRRVERQASLTLRTRPERIDDVSDGVIRVTDRFQGIVVSSNVHSGDDGRGSASFDLRVPSRRLPEALSALSQLAHVRARTQSSQDITRIHVSAQERLRELQAERSSLLRQLAAADTANEAESARARLRIVNGQIADARAALARLGERTTYSSVSVTIEAGNDGEAGESPGWTIGDALADAARILQFVAAVLVVILAVLAPLVMTTLLAAYGARMLRQRRRERALDEGSPTGRPAA